ncbi:Agrin [Fasciola gigantica]|uniref:Agrin n=1 Tax=Fasciola gigantica TaxID=46835 RepID=A0A504Z076_FASGI|nr:Agrin [Fasciola gigantica]
MYALSASLLLFCWCNLSSQFTTEYIYKESRRPHNKLELTKSEGQTSELQLPKSDCFKYRYPPGISDPCENYKCAFQAWCVPSKDFQRPTCVCYNACYDVGDSEDKGPVCGSNGQDYASVCHLRREACTMMTDIEVKYRGKCASNPCLGYTCRWAGERCQVDETGQPKCVCPQPCPNVVSPVCGSDRVTYDSHCHLERTACMKMRDIFILYAGQCTEEPHCELLGLQCQGYEICSRLPTPHVHVPVSRYSNPWSSVISGSQPVQLVARCLCPTCPERGIGDQVCGTDGQTYRSECHLRASACQRQIRQLKVKARGSCDACKTKDCPYHAICRLNSLGEPECICPTDCLYVRKPVCGTDGKMYENECFMKVAACAEQREIHVAQEGPCATCPFGCPLGYQCLKGECVCRDACPKPTALEAEVCGSDGQIYPSECELKRQACLRQTNVRVDPSGARCRDLANRLQTNGTLSGQDGFQAGGQNYLVQPQADENVPASCSCNTVGALSEHCDYRGRCHCKWGVRGERCDQCMPNYWGIQNGHECIACSCHPDGALSTTCDAMTGQCHCRPGIFGRQCSICPNDGRLTKNGCVSPEGIPYGKYYPPMIHILDQIVGSVKMVQSDSKKFNLSDDGLRVSGRRFSADTTLLVRAPFPLKEPFAVQLLLQATAPNGSLLFYQLAPSKQEQMLLENPTGRQFFLDIVNGRIDLRYVSNGPSGRILSVRTSQQLQLGRKHTVRAGVTHGRPWIKLDTGPETTVTDIEERKHEASLSSSLSSGGHGTIVIGRHVLVSTAQYVQPVTKGSVGFSGCLLQLVLRSESTMQEQNVDLISGDPTELAWIGVNQLPSGLAEAPLCQSTDNNPVSSIDQVDRDDKQETIQLDTVTQDKSHSKNPCDRQPCGNGGSCELTSNVGYTCICLPGWQGHHCDQGLILLIPPSMRFAKSNNGPFISIYVDAKGFLFTHCRVGHPMEDGQDVLAPNSRARLVTFRYSVPAQRNQWHTLIVEKRTRALIVQLDNGPKERVRTVPTNFRRLSRYIRQQLTAFDLSESPIYVGGFSPTDQSVPPVPIRNGMMGAVQKNELNKARVRMLADIPSSDERTNERVQYDGLPEPEPDFNEVIKPVQPTNPKSNRCGHLPVAFKGQTTMMFKGLIEDMEEYNLRLRFHTKSENGLLLYISAQSGEAAGTFPHVNSPDPSEITVIELMDGYIKYTIHVPVRTGTSPSTNRQGMRTALHIQSNRAINDGQCHTIHIARSQRSATLITDHHMVSSLFQDTYRSYSPNNVVFLGKFSTIYILPRDKSLRDISNIASLKLK